MVYLLFNFVVHFCAINCNRDSAAESASTVSSAPKTGERRFRFGIVPTYVASMLTEEDPETKIAALEKVRFVL